MKILYIAIFCLITLVMEAQDKPVYYKIPKAPDTYTPETVAARMVDGLGFRYFWATEGLQQNDLDFRPNDDARTTMETLRHIKGLTDVLVKATEQEPNIRGAGNSEDPGFEQLREITLQNIKKASDNLRLDGADLRKMKIIFQRGDNKNEFPFWNILNGPLADAIWHVGQVVSFRRSSGNPLPSGVSVLQGTKRE